MKSIIVMVFLMIFISCSNNHVVSYDLFNPNPKIVPKDVYNLKLPRVQGSDIDEFKKKIGDTTIVLSTGSKMVFGERWYFPVKKDVDVYQLESYFKMKYDVYTIRYDTVRENDVMLGIDVVAFSRRNKMKFTYTIINSDDSTSLDKRYALIFYTYPEYEKYLKK